MSARHYEKTGERFEGQNRSVVRLHCSKCGVSNSIPMSGFRALPPEIIEKKFGQLGWTVGANENRDFCPACSIKERKPTVLKVVEPSSEAPRTMSREDKRIICSKLDEVYLDERRGYDVGWSDHKVATDLAVPRKWVEEVRDDIFGAVGTNEEMSQFMSEFEPLLVEARAALGEARKAREAVEAILKNPAFLTLPHISDRLGKIERLATEVRKLVVTG